MLVALAFCPAPPLLAPALAGGAAGELDGLRQACRTAVGRLLGARPDRVVVLGPGPVTARYGPGSAGTLAGFGVPVAAALGGTPVGPAVLPPALTLGAWLLAGGPTADQPVAGAGLASGGAPRVPVSGVAVGPDAEPAAVAAGLAGPDRLGLLVMGDGSARRSERAPGYVDPRAAGFDAAVAAALATGDAAALRDLDPGLGAELLATGVPAWRVAGHAAAGHATAAAATAAAGHAGGAGLTAELLHDEAPYGVGYLVATWTAR